MYQSEKRQSLSAEGVLLSQPQTDKELSTTGEDLATAADTEETSCLDDKDRNIGSQEPEYLSLPLHELFEPRSLWGFSLRSRSGTLSSRGWDSDASPFSPHSPSSLSCDWPAPQAIPEPLVVYVFHLTEHVSLVLHAMTSVLNFLFAAKIPAIFL